MTYSNDDADFIRDAEPPQARGLTDFDVQHAKPASEPYRMTDTRGLYLWVKPTGDKVWRTNYSVDGVKHLLTLGEYPGMSLAEARIARAKVKVDVRAGANPVAEREAERLARKARITEATAPKQPARIGLRDLDIKHAKPAAKPYRMTDARGLYLWVKPTGGKVWRTVYSVNGRRHLLTLGEYPGMSLAEARAARARVKVEVRAGANPGQERANARAGRIARNARTFRVMATEWHTFMARGSDWSPAFAAETLGRLTRDAFPTIGERPIDAISRAEIFALLERRAFGDATARIRPSRASAHLLRHSLRQAFEHWLMLGLIQTNPADKLSKSFPRVIGAAQPAALTIEDARAVLAAIDATRADLATKLLIRFQALTCVRPTEAREAVWSEIDGALWSIPAERMKGVRGHKVGHDVPLSRQALEVLAVARAALADGGPYVFPARHRGGHKPLSACAPRELMRTTLGPRQHVPHGWRATFSTIMNERHPDADRVFDQMLAHRRGGVEARYNRARYLAHAAERIQEWADLLLDGAASAWALAGRPDPATAEVIAFPAEIREMAI